MGRRGGRGREGRGTYFISLSKSLSARFACCFCFLLSLICGDPARGVRWEGEQDLVRGRERRWLSSLRRARGQKLTQSSTDCLCRLPLSCLVRAAFVSASQHWQNCGRGKGCQRAEAATAVVGMLVVMRFSPQLEREGRRQEGGGRIVTNLAPVAGLGDPVFRHLATSWCFVCKRLREC